MEFSAISIGKFSGVPMWSAQAARLYPCSREKGELEQKVRETSEHGGKEKPSSSEKESKEKGMKKNDPWKVRAHKEKDRVYGNQGSRKSS